MLEENKKKFRKAIWNAAAIVARENTIICDDMFFSGIDIIVDESKEEIENALKKGVRILENNYYICDACKLYKRYGKMTTIYDENNIELGRICDDCIRARFFKGA